METTKPIVYFSKVILSNPFFVRGKAVPFEPLAGNEGVIALSAANPADAQLIEALRDAQSKSMGGILEITKDEYALKKTNPISNQSSRPRKETLRTVPRSLSPFSSTAESAVPAKATEPNPPPAPLPPIVPPSVSAPPAVEPVPVQAAAPADQSQPAPEARRPIARRITRQPTTAPDSEPTPAAS